MVSVARWLSCSWHHRVASPPHIHHPDGVIKGGVTIKASGLLTGKRSDGSESVVELASETMSHHSTIRVSQGVLPCGVHAVCPLNVVRQEVDEADIISKAVTP